MKLQTLKSTLQRLPTKLQGLPPSGANRMRGRAAVDRRARWLDQHPLCCMCEAEGKTTAGTVVDHKTPLWKGGEDDYDKNGQTLCAEHHDAKTAAEAAERASGG